VPQGESPGVEEATTTPDSEAIFNELIRGQLDLQFIGQQLDSDERLDTGDIVDIVRRGEILEALSQEPLDRREIEDAVGVSRATSHRLTRWFDKHGMVTKRDGRFELTGYGLTVLEETLRYERNLVTAKRLAPLLNVICEDHQEFVLEPFANATVTVATPDDPYRPVRRFVLLAESSTTLRGFNTTHMVPLSVSDFFDTVFEGVECEVIYLPNVIDTLFETYPERAEKAVRDGHLRLRTREELPYGLAIFDDRVGIGGYDERTGLMTVFVDTGAAITRKWAEQTYKVFRDRSEPLA
jgi:predicted transcriptional regulator